jgi:hypothetical protein
VFKTNFLLSKQSLKKMPEYKPPKIDDPPEPVPIKKRKKKQTRKRKKPLQNKRTKKKRKIE